VKNILLSLLCITALWSCEKIRFDPAHPDVGKFVGQLKNGTYNTFEKGENGENLWLKMPEFTEKHIRSLIDYSADTSHINAFPVNPISSRMPYPNGRNYFILGECLLWAVEGIRNGTGYGSLDPYLTDTAHPGYDRGVSGRDVLIVNKLYNDWWNTFQDKDWSRQNPLEKSTYSWF
jgi:hypothetical protein